MSAADKKNVNLVIGGSPRADLLPPEIKQDEKNRAQRKNLIGVMIGAAVLVLVGYAGATFVAQGAQAALEAENDKTATILTQQMEFAEAGSLSDQITAVKAARILGMSTESDWEVFLKEFSRSMSPTGVLGVADITVVGSTPLAALPPTVIPLEPSRVTEITLEVGSEKHSVIAAWLDKVDAMTGVVYNTNSEIFWDDKEDMYHTVVTVLFDDSLYLRRFETTTESE